MRKIYTRAQKQHALYIIQQVDGDMSAAASMLNIPTSTLRDWQTAYYRDIRSRNPDRLQPVPHPKWMLTTTTPGTPTPSQLRDNLLRQVAAITATPAKNPRDAYFTALAVRALLDQIRTLTDALDVYPPNP